MQVGLIGRNGDLDLLTSRLRDPASDATAIEIVGEPGIGKTALLDTAVTSLADLLVVRTAATAVEQPLTWTGLAQLVDHWPGADVAALPDAQRHALAGALGRSEQPPEPGLVAAAVAAVLELATARGPVVVAVDDAHWLDEATAGVLAFAVRANRRRPVRLVCARRPVPAPIEPHRVLAATSCTTLALAGLTTAGVHDVLAAAGIELTRPQLIHVHQATGGNPLHVLELARRLLGGEPVDDAIRQTSLESVIGQRVRSIPPAALTVLGAAALTATPTIDVLTRCFDDPTVRSALAAAEQAQLVTLVGSTVRFVHPTLGAAVDAALGSVVRGDLHRRLADVVGDAERALHLDASTDVADADVASALDAAARDAWDRGATEAAAQRMMRAIERTPLPATDVRWERRIALANMLLDLGAGRDAVASIDVGVEAVAPQEPALAARVARTRATCRFHANDEVNAVEELATLAAGFPAGHPTRVDALLARARMSVFVDLAASVEVAAMAAAEAPATGDPGLTATTAACELSCRFLAGEPVDIPDHVASDSRRLTASEMLDELLMWNDDLDRAEPGIRARVAAAEERGDLASVANISLQAAEVHLRRGDVRGAEALYARVLEVASVMDDRAWIASCHASLALTAALRGEVDVARAPLDAARHAAADLSPADQIAVFSSTGTAALLLGDAAAAVEQFRVARATTLDLRLHDCNALPFRAQMVEALIAVGAVEEAREVSVELNEFAAVAGRTRGVGDGHRAAALVAAADGDLDGARAAVEAALDAHDRLPGPLEGAWTRLVAGVIERRAKRRAVARAYFEHARQVTREVGVEALAGRADLELTRMGGRPTTGIDELTPAEEQVARLVALGHTNAEVAAQLHMSAKTVEANLTRIYRKLGVRSRTELAARALT